MVEDALEVSHRGRCRNLVVVFVVGQREREQLGEAGGHARICEDHSRLAEAEESVRGGVLIVEGGIQGAERESFAETWGVSGGRWREGGEEGGQDALGDSAIASNELEDEECGGGHRRRFGAGADARKESAARVGRWNHFTWAAFSSTSSYFFLRHFVLLFPPFGPTRQGFYASVRFLVLICKS